MKITPYEKRGDVRIQGDSGMLTAPNGLLLDKEHDLTIYDRDIQTGVSNGHGSLMRALVDDNICGEYAEQMLFMLLHKLVPENYAKKYLPLLFERVKMVGSKWNLEDL